MAAAHLSALLEAHEVTKWLKQIHSNTEDLQKAVSALYKRFTPIAAKDVDDHFQKEQGPGGKWQPWSAIYRKHRLASVKKGAKRSPKILQMTGNLRQSFRPATNAPVGEFLWINPAKTQSGFPYAYAHDTGGQQLPQRKFMWLSDKALDTITKATLDYVIGNKT